MVTRRHTQKLTIRRPPWPLRALAHLRNGHAGLTSAPPRDQWFAALVPYRWRRAHHWYATLCRYFWLPCPTCGHEFGGHEHDTACGKPWTVPDPTTPGVNRVICPPCTRAGRGVDKW